MTEQRLNQIITRPRDLDGEGGVVEVLIDNQTRLNTLNPEIIASAVSSLNALAKDDSVRCVVLSGAGDKSFIGGADIGVMAGLEPETARAFITSLHELCQAVLDMPVPVIGRINGYTLGAGLEVAACCDWRIASDSARFGMPEVHVGIPSVIEAARLPMLIGWGRTREILMTGRWFGADEAVAMNFIERVVPMAQLDEAVDESLKQVLDAAPGAVRAQKALIDRWEDLDLDAAVQAGIDSFAGCYEGGEPAAYMQKFIDRKR